MTNELRKVLPHALSVPGIGLADGELLSTYFRVVGSRPADPVKQAEDAVRALRAARDPEAKRRATDALEKALKALRGQGAPAPGSTPQGK